MGFYYALEKARFDRTWSKLRKEYQQAGMDEEAIEALYLYDWTAFREQRNYANRTQPLPSESISGHIVETSSLARRFSALTTTFDESDFPGRYAWIDTIENQRLAALLHHFSEKDLDLLTFLLIEGHSQEELAQKWGSSQKTISRHFQRIKKTFINFLK